MSSTAIVPAEAIRKCILLIRGHPVILDAMPAKLYGVETKISSVQCGVTF
jgi:hypothetical protein